MPVHLPTLHMRCNQDSGSREGKLKGKGGGSKVGTLETVEKAIDKADWSESSRDFR